MDLMAKCACGHVAVDVCDTGSGDSDSGEGNRRSGKENGMNIDTENNNRSKTAGAEPDTRTDDARDVSWVDLDKGLHELTENDVFHLKFDCDEEAGLFYETYAKLVGFNVRKVHTRRDENNKVRYRGWVCSREGFRENRINMWDRKRDPKPVSRIGCLAHFRVKYDKKSGKYVVTSFIKEHNHELAPPIVVPFLQPQKRARRVAVDVGFTKKDIEREWASSDIRDGDSRCVLTHSVLAYLSAKNDYDPGLFYKYDLDEENQLCSIFWADSKSRADYAFFGDVLVLNTKFRKNAYEKPFIILAGLNNHDQTTVFGCALLGGKTAETYVWLLETFLEATNHKAPVSVITDGDKAIEEAIQKTFPTSQHRICRWHLFKDAVSSAGDSSSFGPEFKKCMEENWNPEEFEVAWIKLVEKYGLQGHPWFEETYSRRTKWAEAYLREHFFAGLTSIRGHGMNTYFTRFLQVWHKLHEFVRHYDKALVCLREDEAKADSESESAYPAFCTILRDLERHAADVFTRSMFLKVREQIMGDAMLILSGKEYLKDDACWLYKFSEYMKPDAIWKVRYDPSNQSLKCSCFKLVTDGVPCCHMVSVMKAEHLREFPRCCIHKRWTKCARSEIDSGIDIQALNMATQVARFRILNSTCSEMNYYASQTIQGFNETRSLISKITSRVKHIYNSKGEVDETAPEVSLDADGSTTRSGMHDPKSTNSSGQCDATAVETPQPDDCSQRSHDQTTSQQLRLNHGLQTSEGTGTTDDGEGRTQNGEFSGAPSQPINLIWEDND
ncbi:protein FAR1-RELATED SEQUENCE 5-like isoform X1 [Coffea eugenioides]|uniref:Protein FAR1-RELATED SEQUENCE n=2 Tax=Coffea arabica TaxID=13443 RepID=A0A6P6TUE2_COFAR|nr:protein FAR1-RELATED SEQUENCE 5-like isoform X1 [Coffea arabica]XP_027182994.1 protein FAR1-RELATED SEQUENCE 5-like isoform X1 [Coffea eugenioides]XP_027182995.1 protein FAR1-RELATED SEQUENCE 5-like isoform X1 [Coffea eugenioides]XP_027182996.1 protein FAR1-RELATED SEQUENCE 5-like isoform X1 [Coffea eugenioides]